MCKLLKVSRSGYYKYLNHTPSKREIENETWVGDITYISTKEVFLYLMAYMDVYTRKFVG